MENYYAPLGGNGRKNWLQKISQVFQAPFGQKISVTTQLIALTSIFYLITTLFRPLYLMLLFFAPLAFSEPWRFLTAALLHAGIAHLFFNMYSLWILGAAVEPLMRKWQYLGLYLFSAFAGNLFAYGSAVLTDNFGLALVGASGAIFGLFGALLVFTRQIDGNSTGILIMLAINLVIGVLNPHISWQAHIGGFLGGFLYTALLVAFQKLRH